MPNGKLHEKEHLLHNFLLFKNNEKNRIDGNNRKI